MKIQLTEYHCTLYRDAGDPKLYSERAVSHAMKSQLISIGVDVRRVRGDQGLTACPTSSMLKIHNDGSMLWHQRYAVEMSYDAYNEGSVTFQRVQA